MDVFRSIVRALLCAVVIGGGAGAASAREVVGFSGRSSSERSEVLVLLASLAPADPLMRAAPRNLHSVHK
jgi:hypothetical protein